LPKRALIVVDVQRDFLPAGALPVREGDKVIEPINALIDRFVAKGIPVLFTRDWHPKDHRSFKSRGGLWPPHAVKDTPGAQFPPSLHLPKGATIISKAMDKDVEAYSGFHGTDLSARLKSMGVRELYVVGLATDYCVKNTVIDGMKDGFRLFIVRDSVRGVNLKRTDSATAFRKMISRGARTITSQQLLRSLSGRGANPAQAIEKQSNN
jgi:nicotinamidase/pyrazinamidase